MKRETVFFENEHCVGCATATYLGQKLDILILNKEMIKKINYYCDYEAVLNISLSKNI